MRKHHTNNASSPRRAHVHALRVVEGDAVYMIPREIARQYIVSPEKPRSNNKNISAEAIFAKLDRKRTKPGALLKRLRSRENLTQVAFAKKIGVSQANLSKMENGARNIGKTVAMRIARVFNIDYRTFL